MPGLAGNTRALPKAVRAQRGKTSQILWTPYGLPMDSLWTPYGLPMEQYRSHTAATPEHLQTITPRPSAAQGVPSQPRLVARVQPYLHVGSGLVRNCLRPTKHAAQDCRRLQSLLQDDGALRSEERRVGKEGR